MYLMDQHNRIYDWYNNASIDAARTVNFELGSSILEMSGLEVLASRADEKTP